MCPLTDRQDLAQNAQGDDAGFLAARAIFTDGARQPRKFQIVQPVFSQSLAKAPRFTLAADEAGVHKIRPSQQDTTKLIIQRVTVGHDQRRLIILKLLRATHRIEALINADIGSLRHLRTLIRTRIKNGYPNGQL